MELRGKVGLITGGGTGLGREIALQLAKEGMDLAINYSRSKAEAEQTVADLQELGVKAQAIQADVADTAQVKWMVSQVDSSFGRLDLLINNAGTTRFVPMKNIEELTEEDWDRLYNTNVKGAFFTAQAAANLMRRNGGGHIINTTSIAGVRPQGSSMPYCVSKAGLIHLTRCLAVALAPEIQVNGVAPGLLLTRWGEKFGPEQIKQLADRALLKRVTELEDCAALFVNLAKNGSITGQNIVLDAGLTLA
jgi:3-oxoacyl-[acyl-carrier protein] reductase